MNKISVMLVYAASSEKQFLQEVVVNENSTILEVINASNIGKVHPEINLAINKVGIASEVKTLDTKVHVNDRVEIYRPLIFDPMSARRLKAKGLALSQSPQGGDRHQKTPSRDVPQPNPHVVATDKYNPNDQD